MLDIADICNSLKSLMWRASGVRRDGATPIHLPVLTPDSTSFVLAQADASLPGYDDVVQQIDADQLGGFFQSSSHRKVLTARGWVA